MGFAAALLTGAEAQPVAETWRPAAERRVSTRQPAERAEPVGQTDEPEPQHGLVRRPVHWVPAVRVVLPGPEASGGHPLEQSLQVFAERPDGAEFPGRARRQGLAAAAGCRLA
jgi:hypothetical protein